MLKNKRKIYIIGLNSYKFQDLSLDLQEIFIKTKNIAVPETFYDEIKSWFSEKLIAEKKFFKSKSDINLIKYLKSTSSDVILISRGDPLWYGIGRVLLKNFSKKELYFFPAHTSVQLAFSKLKESWQEAKIVSLHGRDSKELINLFKSKEKKIAILTDPKNRSLEIIRNNLRELNLDNFYEFWLIEEIGLEKEKIRLIANDENLPQIISDLNIVILLKKNINNLKHSLPLFGINDSFFKTFDDRPNLITKREIRIQILADLELVEHATLLDIGSGCGTIGLEALRIRPGIELICIDKRLGSKELTLENANKLGVAPKTIVEGNIKEYLVSLSKKYFLNCNRVIIGGCDKKTKLFVIKELNKFLKKGDIFVIPIITYEVIQEVNVALKLLNYETNLKLIQTFKGLSISEGTRFEPNNPVFIIKAKKK